MIPLEIIIKQFGKEKGLIILALRVYFKKVEPKIFAAYIEEYEIDWSFLYELVTEYELRPQVFEVFTLYAKDFDNQIMSRLRLQCKYLAADNLEKVRETIRLATLFKEHNIAVVPYKGVFLSDTLYGDFTTRETCDIDFLISPKETLLVTQLLVADGYQIDTYFNESDEAQIIKYTNGRAFYKKAASGHQMSVETHWGLLPQSFDVPLSISEVTSKITPVTILGRRIELMNTENILLTMLVHHGVNDVWRTLKHVVDVAAFLERYNDEMDWVQFRNRAEEVKIKKTTQAGFYLAHTLLGAPMPKGFDTTESKGNCRVLVSLFKYPMLSKFKYSAENFSQHLALRDNIADQTSYLYKCFKLIFTPTASDLKWKRLPKKFHFVYFILKPYRLILNRIKG